MNPLDKIISFFREEGMMTANPPGGSGGFSGSADPKGPRAGFDPVMKTFIIFLNRLPAYPKSTFHDVQVDLECLKQLNQACKKDETD